MNAYNIQNQTNKNSNQTQNQINELILNVHKKIFELQ